MKDRDAPPQSIHEAQEPRFRWKFDGTMDSGRRRYKLVSHGLFRILEVGPDDNVVKLYADHSTGLTNLDRFATEPEESANDWVRNNFNI